MGMFDKLRKKKEQQENCTGADPTRLDLKVSAPQPCKIDYGMSVEELKVFCDEQYKKIAAGDKEYMTGEFMQLGYALDFIDFMKEVFGVTLDLEERAVPALESFLDTISRETQEAKGQKLSQEVMNDIMKKATGFFSVVIWKNIGGGFISSNIGNGVNINGTNVFLYNRIGRRLQGDASSDMVSLYETLKGL